MTCHYSFLGRSLSLLDTKAESANSVRISPSTLTSSAAMTSGLFSMFIDIAAEQKGRVLQQRAHTMASRNRSGACTYMKKRCTCTCTCITIMPKFLELFTNPPPLHSRNVVVLDVVLLVELVLYMKRK